MAGFRKAEPKQAYLKLSMYGPAGSGKTATALLIAEGIAARQGKRVAYVDTERGTDFYALPVPDRKWHPEAFDFDALYTRSLTEALQAVRDLDPRHHGVVVIDSVTHLWEAAIAAYTGSKTRGGTIPIHAWSRIKAPYKELMARLINGSYHALILGRQGTVFGEHEESGEMRAEGFKMRAEGETAYEPHVCLRLESVRPVGRGKGAAEAVPTAYVEKDRTGLLQGKVIKWPSFELVASPMLGLLGLAQAQIQSEEDAAYLDGEALARQDREARAASRIRREQYEAKFRLAAGLADVEALGKELTADVKKQMLKEDVDALREAYLAARDRVRPDAGGAGKEGKEGKG
jgi:hypothetical protein